MPKRRISLKSVVVLLFTGSEKHEYANGRLSPSPRMGGTVVN
jgi:hypothetical protein